MKRAKKCFLAPVLALLAALAALPAHAAFSDNGDGTVTDTVTGLMWDKCPYGQTANDCSGGSAIRFTWASALAQTVGLNSINYKGHKDWRLPNIRELESLVKIVLTNPAIDLVAFPNTDLTQKYWSSTLTVHDTASAWAVSFQTGDFFGLDWTQQADNSFLRVVRSGQPGDNFDLLAPQPIDIDGNHSYDALTDGLLIIRYLSGLTGTALTNGAIGAGATRSTPADILHYLDTIRPSLDIDVNGQFDAATDGLLVIRYMFGLRGASLIAGAVGTGATRASAPLIEPYIQSLMP